MEDSLPSPKSRGAWRFALGLRASQRSAWKWQTADVRQASAGGVAGLGPPPGLSHGPHGLPLRKGSSLSLGRFKDTEHDMPQAVLLKPDSTFKDWGPFLKKKNRYPAAGKTNQNLKIGMDHLYLLRAPQMYLAQGRKLTMLRCVFATTASEEMRSVVPRGTKRLPIAE